MDGGLVFYDFFVRKQNNEKRTHTHTLSHSLTVSYHPYIYFWYAHTCTLTLKPSHKGLLFSKYAHSHTQTHIYVRIDIANTSHIYGYACMPHILHVLLFCNWYYCVFLLLVITFLHSSNFSPNLVFLWHIFAKSRKKRSKMKQNEDSFF